MRMQRDNLASHAQRSRIWQATERNCNVSYRDELILEACEIMFSTDARYLDKTWKKHLDDSVDVETY